MILNISLDLPGDGSYLRIARHVGRLLLEDMGVVKDDIDDIEFVVGELCSNVIRHAKTTDGRFRVALEYFAEQVVVRVEDRGIGFSFKDVRPVGTVRPDLAGGERIGGFGLDLVRTLTDRLEFLRSDSQGTTVQAELLLHYKSAAEAREADHLDRSSGGRMTVQSGTHDPTTQSPT
jgi:serine/threonine-protein kinase RsbW